MAEESVRARGHVPDSRRVIFAGRKLAMILVAVERDVHNSSAVAAQLANQDPVFQSRQSQAVPSLLEVAKVDPSGLTSTAVSLHPSEPLSSPTGRKRRPRSFRIHPSPAVTLTIRAIAGPEVRGGDVGAVGEQHQYDVRPQTPARSLSCSVVARHERLAAIGTERCSHDLSSTVERANEAAS